MSQKDKKETRKPQVKAIAAPSLSPKISTTQEFTKERKKKREIMGSKKATVNKREQNGRGEIKKETRKKIINQRKLRTGKNIKSKYT